MSSTLRKEVIACFRKLHRTTRCTFKDDQIALKEARRRINEEFEKNRNESNGDKIRELLKFGSDVEHLVRTTVVQAKLTPEGNYEVQINEDTKKFNNVPYREI